MRGVGIGAYEARVARFAEAEQQRADLEAEQKRREPTEAEKHSARMLVEAFGLRQTGQPAPALKELHDAFVASREEGVRPARTLERTPVGAEEAHRGIQRTSRTFEMVRDWDNKESSSHGHQR